MNFKIREESTKDLSVFMNLPPELQVRILSGGDCCQAEGDICGCLHAILAEDRASTDDQQRRLLVMIGLACL